MWSILAFILYAFILFMIGLWAHKKSTVTSEISSSNALDQHLMGNRSLNFYVTALSAHASDMSSWIFLAFPMQMYVNGANSIVIAIGLLVGMWMNWQFVAKKVRIMSAESNSYTLNGLLLYYFPSYPKTLNALMGISLILFTTYYLAAGLTSIGLLFDSMFGINYYAGVIMAVVLVLSYTTIGGFVSVAWTDFFQAVFLLLMILLVPMISFYRYSSWEKIHSILILKREPITIPSILTAISWGLGYFGMPHIVTKFMGIKDPQEVVKSKWLGMSWQFIALSGSVCIGLVAKSMIDPSLHWEETLFIHMVEKSFHPFFGSFILCGVLAATISTMDSQILVLSTSAQQDLRSIFKIFRISKINDLHFARLGGVIATLIAMGIALLKSETINETVFYAWSGLGLSFGPILLLALFYMPKRVGKDVDSKIYSISAIITILSAILVTFIWPVVSKWCGFEYIPTMLFGFVFCLFSFFVSKKLLYLKLKIR